MSTGNIDPNAAVRAFEKLLDYTASGVGAVAGPMLGPWKARREADAHRITAQGDADARRITAQGDADAMGIITRAQADARKSLASTYVDVQGEINIAERVSQRIQFQEEKRQHNIGAVVRRAAEELGDEDVPDEEPDYDWTARFFNYIQDVSSEEMQSLWAKVLAGEIARPGGISVRSLSILRNLDQATAKLFQILCSCCVIFEPGGHRILDARVPSLGGDPGDNSLRDFGLAFSDLNVLNEHGLIISSYNSWYDMKPCAGIPTEAGIVRIPFKFQGRHWILTQLDDREPGSECRVSGVALTRAGQELSRMVECVPASDYYQALANFFATQHLTMTEVDGHAAHVTQREMRNRVTIAASTDNPSHSVQHDR